jgi:hypothetical protein
MAAIGLRSEHRYLQAQVGRQEVSREFMLSTMTKAFIDLVSVLQHLLLTNCSPELGTHSDTNLAVCSDNSHCHL